MAGFEFKRATLPNGLNIIGEVDPTAHTAAMGFFVKTGARDEKSDVMGVSHFLEHMMFKGTETRTADDVNQQFDDIGANFNAFTSHETTAFWAHVLPEYIDKAEDILADILRPSLRQEDFDTEKGVILEEIAMYADNPFWVLYEKAMEHYYKEHPLRHRVLGTNETIQALTCDQMTTYFEDRYSADNAVVAFAGNLDFDKHVESIANRCGHWQTTNTKRQYQEVNVETNSFTECSEKVNRHYLLMISPAPAIQDDDRYPAAILSSILGDADGSRLYWSLVDTGLADDAQAQYDGRDGVGEYYTYVSSSPSESEHVEEIALEQIESLQSSITDDDLVRVRGKIATSATLSGERPGGRMRRLGQMWNYSDEYRSLETELERINAVTIDDLHRVAEKYPLKPQAIGRLMPAE